MGGEFGLNSKGRASAYIKKSKEGVVSNTKVVFKVRDCARIAIDAIKPLKQRDVALQSNIDRFKWTKETYEVRQVSIPKNGIAAPYYYLEGKCWPFRIFRQPTCCDPASEKSIDIIAACTLLSSSRMLGR
jgi:hypothetical protein